MNRSSDGGGCDGSSIGNGIELGVVWRDQLRGCDRAGDCQRRGLQGHRGRLVRLSGQKMQPARRGQVPHNQAPACCAVQLPVHGAPAEAGSLRTRSCVGGVGPK